jgi:flagellar hook-length control protein FliK
MNNGQLTLLSVVTATKTANLGPVVASTETIELMQQNGENFAGLLKGLQLSVQGTFQPDSAQSESSQNEAHNSLSEFQVQDRPTVDLASLLKRSLRIISASEAAESDPVQSENGEAGADLTPLRSELSEVALQMAVAAYLQTGRMPTMNEQKSFSVDTLQNVEAVPAAMVTMNVPDTGSGEHVDVREIPAIVQNAETGEQLKTAVDLLQNAETQIEQPVDVSLPVVYKHVEGAIAQLPAVTVTQSVSLVEHSIEEPIVRRNQSEPMVNAPFALEPASTEVAAPVAQELPEAVAPVAVTAPEAVNRVSQPSVDRQQNAAAAEQPVMSSVPAVTLTSRQDAEAPRNAAPQTPVGQFVTSVTPAVTEVTVQPMVAQIAEASVPHAVIRSQQPDPIAPTPSARKPLVPVVLSLPESPPAAVASEVAPIPLAVNRPAQPRVEGLQKVAVTAEPVFPAISVAAKMPVQPTVSPVVEAPAPSVVIWNQHSEPTAPTTNAKQPVAPVTAPPAVSMPARTTQKSPTETVSPVAFNKQKTVASAPEQAVVSSAPGLIAGTKPQVAEAPWNPAPVTEMPLRSIVTRNQHSDQMVPTLNVKQPSVPVAVSLAAAPPTEVVVSPSAVSKQARPSVDKPQPAAVAAETAIPATPTVKVRTEAVDTATPEPTTVQLSGPLVAKSAAVPTAVAAPEQPATAPFAPVSTAEAPVKPVASQSHHQPEVATATAAERHPVAPVSVSTPVAPRVVEEAALLKPEPVTSAAPVAVNKPAQPQVETVQKVVVASETTIPATPVVRTREEAVVTTTPEPTAAQPSGPQVAKPAVTPVTAEAAVEPAAAPVAPVATAEAPVKPAVSQNHHQHEVATATAAERHIVAPVSVSTPVAPRVVEEAVLLKPEPVTTTSPVAVNKPAQPQVEAVEKVAVASETAIPATPTVRTRAEAVAIATPEPTAAQPSGPQVAKPTAVPTAVSAPEQPATAPVAPVVTAEAPVKPVVSQNHHQPEVAAATAAERHPVAPVPVTTPVAPRVVEEAALLKPEPVTSATPVVRTRAEAVVTTIPEPTAAQPSGPQVAKPTAVPTAVSAPEQPATAPVAPVVTAEAPVKPVVSQNHHQPEVAAATAAERHPVAPVLVTTPVAPRVVEEAALLKPEPTISAAPVAVNKPAQPQVEAAQKVAVAAKTALPATPVVRTWADAVVTTTSEPTAAQPSGPQVSKPAVAPVTAEAAIKPATAPVAPVVVAEAPLKPVASPNHHHPEVATATAAERHIVAPVSVTMPVAPRVVEEAALLKPEPTISAAPVAVNKPAQPQVEAAQKVVVASEAVIPATPVVRTRAEAVVIAAPEPTTVQPSGTQVAKPAVTPFTAEAAIEPATAPVAPVVVAEAPVKPAVSQNHHQPEVATATAAERHPVAPVSVSTPVAPRVVEEAALLKPEPTISAAPVAVNKPVQPQVEAAQQVSVASETAIPATPAAEVRAEAVDKASPESAVAQPSGPQIIKPATVPATAAAPAEAPVKPVVSQNHHQPEVASTTTADRHPVAPVSVSIPVAPRVVEEAALLKPEPTISAAPVAVNKPAQPQVEAAQNVAVASEAVIPATPVVRTRAEAVVIAAPEPTTVQPSGTQVAKPAVTPFTAEAAIEPATAPVAPVVVAEAPVKPAVSQNHHQPEVATATAAERHPVAPVSVSTPVAPRVVEEAALLKPEPTISAAPVAVNKPVQPQVEAAQQVSVASETAIPATPAAEVRAEAVVTTTPEPITVQPSGPQVSKPAVTPVTAEAAIKTATVPVAVVESPVKLVVSQNHHQPEVAAATAAERHPVAPVSVTTPVAPRVVEEAALLKPEPTISAAPVAVNKPAQPQVEAASETAIPATPAVRTREEAVVTTTPEPTAVQPSSPQVVKPAVTPVTAEAAIKTATVPVAVVESPVKSVVSQNHHQPEVASATTADLHPVAPVSVSTPVAPHVVEEETPRKPEPVTSAAPVPVNKQAQPHVEAAQKVSVASETVIPATPAVKVPAEAVEAATPESAVAQPSGPQVPKPATVSATAAAPAEAPVNSVVNQNHHQPEVASATTADRHPVAPVSVSIPVAPHVVKEEATLKPEPVTSAAPVSVNKPAQPQEEAASETAIPATPAAEVRAEAVDKASPESAVAQPSGPQVTKPATVSATAAAPAEAPVNSVVNQNHHQPEVASATTADRHPVAPVSVSIPVAPHVVKEEATLKPEPVTSAAPVSVNKPAQPQEEAASETAIPATPAAEVRAEAVDKASPESAVAQPSGPQVTKPATVSATAAAPAEAPVKPVVSQNHRQPEVTTTTAAERHSTAPVSVSTPVDPHVVEEAELLKPEPVTSATPVSANKPAQPQVEGAQKVTVASETAVPATPTVEVWAEAVEAATPESAVVQPSGLQVAKPEAPPIAAITAVEPAAVPAAPVAAVSTLVAPRVVVETAVPDSEPTASVSPVLVNTSPAQPHVEEARKEAVATAPVIPVTTVEEATETPEIAVAQLSGPQVVKPAVTSEVPDAEVKTVDRQNHHLPEVAPGPTSIIPRVVEETAVPESEPTASVPPVSVSKPTQHSVDKQESVVVAPEQPIVSSAPVAKDEAEPTVAESPRNVAPQPLATPIVKTAVPAVTEVSVQPATAPGAESTANNNFAQPSVDKLQAAAVEPETTAPRVIVTQPVNTAVQSYGTAQETELDIVISQTQPIATRIAAQSALVGNRAATAPLIQKQDASARSARQSLFSELQNDKGMSGKELDQVKEMTSSLSMTDSAGEQSGDSGMSQSGGGDQEKFGRNAENQLLVQDGRVQSGPQQQKVTAVSGQPDSIERAPQEIPEQIVHEIKERLLRHELKSGNQQITLTLSPDHLGELKMNLNLQGQKLSVEIVTENRMVRDAMVQNTDALKESLARQNITMESFDVSTGGKGANSQGQNQNAWRELTKQQQQQQLWASARNFNSAQADIPSRQAAYQKQRGHSMLDILY